MSADWAASMNAGQTRLLEQLRELSDESQTSWVLAIDLATTFRRNRRSIGSRLASLERIGVVESRFDAAARLKSWRPKDPA